ncbi:MAG: TolC family protein, partial [Prevotellaceae bacterium]|nr:TolC family protein [Prevotellaceae bacterium]
DATFSATDNLKQAINYIPSEIFGGEPGTYRAITMGQQYVSSGIISPQFDLLNPYAIARVKVSKTNEQLTMITNQLNKKDLYETISACYHNILSYQRQLKVLNESLANADTLSFIMQQKNKEGIARVQDVNNSLANVLSVKDRIQQTEIMLNQEYNNMKLLCDMDKNITVEIIPGIIPPQFNASLSANSSLEEQRAESQLKYDLATLKANKMIFLPTIGFFSEFGWHQYTNNRFFDKNTWFNANYIGLKLTIPIFPSISGISAVKYSKVNMRMDKNNLNHSRLQDSMNNRKLESDYQKAFNSYLLLTEIEGLKKDSYKRNLLVYQEGLLSSNDLFVSFNEWIDSSMNTVSQWAVSEYMMSKIMITNTFN